MLSLSYPKAKLEEFVQRLVGSRLTSIDAFLENNSDHYQQIGKAAIAGTILLREYEAATKLAKGRIDDDWLQYVWNAMRASTTVDTFPENRVTFVTFNYDRLVENYFDGVLTNAFNLNHAAAEALRDRTFQVLHLHGAIEGVPFGEFSRPLKGKLLSELAKGIRIVHDDVLANDPTFQCAYRALGQAYRTCLLGFGYHPDNVRRLDLNGHLKSSELTGTAFGMGDAEVSMARSAVGRAFRTGFSIENCGHFLRRLVTLE